VLSLSVAPAISLNQTPVAPVSPASLPSPPKPVADFVAGEVLDPSALKRIQTLSLALSRVGANLHPAVGHPLTLDALHFASQKYLPYMNCGGGPALVPHSF